MPRAMLVTDLDGTLLDGQGRLSRRSWDMLVRLGALGISRVVATGRSPFSFQKAVPSDLPIDYAVLSSGAGIVSWPDRSLLRAEHLHREEIVHVARTLEALGMDFMVHRPIPDNHCFCYRQLGKANPDFEQRIALYATYAEPLGETFDGFDRGAQFVAIVDHHHPPHAVETVRQHLPHLSILRTTSPLDHRSTWIEVFPHGVNKATATAWLSQRLGVARQRILAVGNDFNDLDLLEWAGTSRVVANAPETLRTRFEVTASHDDNGVVEAVEAWLDAWGEQVS